MPVPSFAVSENQSRPIHTGCLFEVDDETISVVAVDGYRLARRTYHLKEATGKTMQFVVPAAALKEVEKILGEDEMVTFILGPKHILFEVGNATLICRLLEGDFLDWRRVVPTDCPVKLTAHVDDLAATIDRVGLIVTEKLKSPVRCLFGDNVATFRTTTAIGAAEDQCAIAGNGEELEIGFNCRYLADALRAVPARRSAWSSKRAQPHCLYPSAGRGRLCLYGVTGSSACQLRSNTEEEHRLKVVVKRKEPQSKPIPISTEFIRLEALLKLPMPCPQGEWPKTSSRTDRFWSMERSVPCEGKSCALGTPLPAWAPPIR